MKIFLKAIYREYINGLNKRDLAQLGRFVHDEVCYNDRLIGLTGYRDMLEGNYRDIPDLYFNIHTLVCEPPYISSHLRFDVTPKGQFMGLPVDGRSVLFYENVIYKYEDGKIKQVWSVIDKAAIEAQIGR
ncbi:MAG: ester cyclase [Paenibacillus sp.]|uniref:ester cyclase n=1 Tax=Paenibacillus sp. TaxID=58172 RepID=UPI00290E9F1D|nr:ester cyclase [Paenibacillus sp.]MDU4694456.1 ester cyclase [Paenibacillus sp.]